MIDSFGSNVSPYSQYSSEIPPLQPNEVSLVIPNFRARYLNQSSEFAFPIHSEWKHLENFTYRLMFFPSSSSNSVGAFIEVQPRPDWPKNWIFLGVHYNIFILHCSDPLKSIYKQDIFTFSSQEIDRGWHGIATYPQLQEFLTPNGDLMLRAGVYLQGTEFDLDVRDPDYDCRKNTGHVGLLNHGATCYINALIQSLYNIGKFCNSVFSLNFKINYLGPHSSHLLPKLIQNNIGIDALSDLDIKKILLEEEKEKAEIPSVSLALQNLFYKLYFSKDPPHTKELIKSFGWDAVDAFTQHDSHELLKLLLGRVEEQMKGTPAEGMIGELFGGEMETYIECIDVDYKSVRKENFEDIQLDVQGCSNIYESLKHAVEPEILDGDNMYEAEGHGKQRAKKGIRFIKFPNVCIFLLKRFTFNIQCMDTVKLNSRFEFYKEIDLTPFCSSPSSDSKDEYVLQAVSVHQGGINSGHYYAFCRVPNIGTSPENSAGWLKFDDDKVYRVSEYAAIGDNFGGGIFDCYNYLIHDKAYKLPKFKSYNAYILVYVRKNKLDEILYKNDPRTINPQLVERCQTQDKISLVKHQIRQRLGKFVKINLFYKTDFVNYTFLDQPFINWQHVGLTAKFERNEQLGSVLLKLAKMASGHGANDLVDLSTIDYDISNFHLMGLSNDINRFEHLSSFNNKNNNQLDKYTPVFSGISDETIHDLIRRVNLNIIDPYDPTIYLLYFPLSQDSFKLYHLKDSESSELSNLALLIIKYFDIFAKDPNQNNLICVDLFYINANNKLYFLELPILERILVLMKNGRITPYYMDELHAMIEKYAKNNNYDEFHENLELSKFLLKAYVETNGNAEPISLKKTLLQLKIFTGDIIVVNFVNQEKEDLWGKSCNSRQDFEETKELYVSDYDEDVVKATFNRALFTDPSNELSKSLSIQLLESPPLATFPVYDFPTFLELLVNKVSVTFKLYDPLQNLAFPVNCSGQLISNLENVNLEESNTCTLSSYSSFSSDISEGGEIGEMCNALKSIPIMTQTFDLDLRCPVKKVLKYVCWHMKVDPSHILLFPKSPLLSPINSEFFSIDHFFHRESIGYEQITLGQLIKTLCAFSHYRNTTAPETAVLHLCLVPWHYSKIMGKNPLTKHIEEDVHGKVVVAQFLNQKVQVTHSAIAKIDVKTCTNVGELIYKFTGDSEQWALVGQQGHLITHYDNDTSLSELYQFKNNALKNFFACPLRIEPSFAKQKRGLVQDKKLFPLTVLHQTPEREFFGFPFIIFIEPNDNIATIKNKIRDKISIPQQEWVRWSFMQYDGITRTWKSNEDILDIELPSVCFLAEHQMPYQKIRGHGIMKIA